MLVTQREPGTVLRRGFGSHPGQDAGGVGWLDADLDLGRQLGRSRGRGGSGAEGFEAGEGAALVLELGPGAGRRPLRERDLPGEAAPVRLPIHPRRGARGCAVPGSSRRTELATAHCFPLPDLVARFVQPVSTRVREPDSASPPSASRPPASTANRPVPSPLLGLCDGPQKVERGVLDSSAWRTADAAPPTAAAEPQRRDRRQHQHVRLPGVAGEPFLERPEHRAFGRSSRSCWTERRKESKGSSGWSTRLVGAAAWARSSRSASSSEIASKSLGRPAARLVRISASSPRQRQRTPKISISPDAARSSSKRPPPAISPAARSPAVVDHLGPMRQSRRVEPERQPGRRSAQVGRQRTEGVDQPFEVGSRATVDDVDVLRQAGRAVGNSERNRKQDEINLVAGQSRQRPLKSVKPEKPPSSTTRTSSASRCSSTSSRSR